MNRYSRTAACLSLAIGSAALAAPGPGQRDADGELRSERVSYADLDLGQAAGVATLQRRLHSAARRVCGLDSPPRLLREFAEGQKCKRNALAAVLDDMDLAITGRANRTFAALTIGAPAGR